MTVLMFKYHFVLDQKFKYLWKLPLKNKKNIFENIGQETSDFKHKMNQFKVQIHTLSLLGMENVILNTDT